MKNIFTFLVEIVTLFLILLFTGQKYQKAISEEKDVWAVGKSLASYRLASRPEPVEKERQAASDTIGPTVVVVRRWPRGLWLASEWGSVAAAVAAAAAARCAPVSAVSQSVSAVSAVSAPPLQQLCVAFGATCRHPAAVIPSIHPHRQPTVPRCLSAAASPQACLFVCTYLKNK